MDPVRLRKLRDSILTRNNARILPIERKDFARRAPEIKELFNDIWSKKLGPYSPDRPPVSATSSSRFSRWCAPTSKA